MKITKIMRGGRHFSSNEEWIYKAADFLREHSGQMFIFAPGNVVIYADENSDEKILRIWFPFDRIRPIAIIRQYGFVNEELIVEHFAGVPAGLDIAGVSDWLDRQNEKMWADKRRASRVSRQRRSKKPV